MLYLQYGHPKWLKSAVNAADTVRGRGFDPLVGKIPRRRKQPIPIFFPVNLMDRGTNSP